MKKYKRFKLTIARQVIEMPPHTAIGCGNFWFFLPVPFLYKTWPFKTGEKLLVTVTQWKKKT